jgi:methylenetetrahydrofolate dehydrogenase (NADP+)/methenyltetrahydrofolate cyclohydrolase
VTARKLDGVANAKAIRDELVPQVREFTAAHGRPPSLHILLVGDDPGSRVYVRNKKAAGIETGLRVVVHELPATATQDQVLALVRERNADDACDAILVQSPLPHGLGKAAEQLVFDTIDPAKDADCFHPENVGRLVQGRAVLAPCTPSGVIELLVREKIPMAGRRALVIGRSEIVGKPMALLLLQRDATVTICHSKTADLAARAAEADILVAAIGRPAFVTRAFVKPGAVVIDVGINPLSDRSRVAQIFGDPSSRLTAFDSKGSTICGDVHPEVGEVAGALTPVPGGVGPLTIAMLLKNTLRAAQTRYNVLHMKT